MHRKKKQEPFRATKKVTETTHTSCFTMFFMSLVYSASLSRVRADNFSPLQVT